MAWRQSTTSKTTRQRWGLALSKHCSSILTEIIDQQTISALRKSLTSSGWKLTRLTDRALPRIGELQIVACMAYPKFYRRKRISRGLHNLLSVSLSRLELRNPKGGSKTFRSKIGKITQARTGCSWRLSLPLCTRTLSSLTPSRMARCRNSCKRTMRRSSRRRAQELRTTHPSRW